MATPSDARRLLQAVVRRLRMASFAKQASLLLFAVGLLYAALLLASRLLGLLPDWFTWASLAVVPAVALIAAFLFHRRVSLVDAAREIDRAEGTKDLFLNLALLERSAGAYRPLVSRAAEEKARHITPPEVIPFRWIRGVVQAAVLLAVLGLGNLFLPQLDPFGQVAQANEQEQRRETLEETNKATLAQKARLKKESNSQDIERAVKKLKSSFNKAKPKQKEKNFERLVRHQKSLGQRWRKLRGKKLKDLLSQSRRGQQFGGGQRQEKLKKWTRDLKNGRTDSLRKEIESVKQSLQKLAKTDDPVKKSQLRRQVKKQLRDLQQFASKRAGSASLNAALNRAMKQLELAENAELSDEALKGLSESLDLSQLELEQIAQSAKNLQKLEEALKTLQLAKQLSNQGKLDGKACQGCQSISEYAKLFAGMCNKPGKGLGMRGPGIGQGGQATEKEDHPAHSDFKTERSRADVTAGKVLLSLKSRGTAKEGEAKKAYRKQIRQLKQGLSEAIRQEDIPPGYHKGIKNYFDTIEEPAAGQSE